ncbi:hypothetical protein HYW41_04595 [Candidatus Daviesbacteria bacterium]|nr:hypothetical protein [Candidatus Daviesbacteria bacterium]
MQKGFAQLLMISVVLTILASGGVYWILRNKQPKNINQPDIKKTILPIQKNVLSLKSVEKNKEQTYQNKQLGFQLTYPNEDLTVKEDSEEEYNKRGNGDFRKNFKGYVGYEPGKLLGAVVVLEKDQNFDKSPISVWVFDNPNGLTVESWFDKYWYYPFLWGVFDFESKGHVALDKEATISGKIAKYKIVTYQPNTPKYLYISNNGKMYLFRIIDESGDKILESFKFSEML